VKKKLDRIDRQILSHLDKDARQPVKKISEAIGKKVSTVYHRISRLIDQKIITGYFVSLNPDYLNIERRNSVKIILKSTLVPKFNTKFITSFGQFLCSEFQDIAFLSVIKSEEALQLISVHSDEEIEKQFFTKLKMNPYIEKIEITPLTMIMKGERLFQFNGLFDSDDFEDEFDEIEPEEIGIDELDIDEDEI
jgi:DNA-binding Lrp family transcriptional regulator